MDNITPEMIEDVAARTGQPRELVQKAAEALPVVLQAFTTVAQAVLTLPAFKAVAEHADAFLSLVPPEQREQALRVALALAFAAAGGEGAAPKKGARRPFRACDARTFDDYLVIKGPGGDIKLPYGQGTDENEAQRAHAQRLVEVLNAGWTAAGEEGTSR